MESAVDKTRDVIRDQWAALGKEHGDVSEIWRTQVDKAGDLFKENWSSLKESVDQTGDKVERAFRAAWEELKKRD
jgi:hypothetical protein